MKKRKKNKGPYPGMMAVFALDGKTGEMDSFMRFDTGPVPPFIRPPEPDKPKDCDPSKPGKRKKTPKPS